MKKNKGGRPKFVIDYAQLDAMCNILCTEEECAAIMGCDKDTLTAALRRDGYAGFSAYAKKWSSEGKMSLRRRQFESAMAGSVPLLIWLGKQWLDQRDAPEPVVTQNAIKIIYERIDAADTGKD